MLIISRNQDQSLYIFQNDQQFHVKVLDIRDSERVEIGITTSREPKLAPSKILRHDINVKNIKNLKNIKNESFNILLVEDSPLVQKINSSFLEKLGYPYRLASTGKDAVSCIKTGNYNLIFLDVGLPDMSGLDVLKTIRQYEKGKKNGKELNIRTPIVMLTAKEKKLKKECMEAGADLFEQKPIAMQKMQEIIERYK